MMKINKQNSLVNRKNITVALIIAVIAAGSYLTYSHYADKEGPDNSSAQEPINYNPPSEQEVIDSQNAKKNPPPGSAEGNDSQLHSPDQTTTHENKKSVDIGISFADVINENLEVRSFTNSIIEEGECYITASHEGKQVSRKVEAFIDVSSTQCSPAFIPISELSPGTWRVEVEFTSGSAHGKSDILEVTIP